MFKILGVDPGSTCTGYGIVAGEGNHFSYVDSGAFVLGKSRSRYERLGVIFSSIQRVIREHAPTHFAIEEVFYSKNPKTSLVLGEARGVAILAAQLAGLPIAEYSAREVKQSVTGHGGADKGQVNFMLGKILTMKTPPTNSDESDALAIAVCHAFKSREWTVL